MRKLNYTQQWTLGRIEWVQQQNGVYHNGFGRHSPEPDYSNVAAALELEKRGLIEFADGTRPPNPAFTRNWGIRFDAKMTPEGTRILKQIESGEYDAPKRKPRRRRSLATTR